MDRSCYIEASQVIAEVIKEMTPTRLGDEENEIYKIRFTQAELNTAVFEYMMENDLINSRGVWDLNRRMKNKNGEYEFTFIKESN